MAAWPRRPPALYLLSSYSSITTAEAESAPEDKWMLRESGQAADLDTARSARQVNPIGLPESSLLVLMTLPVTNLHLDVRHTRVCRLAREARSRATPATS